MAGVRAETVSEPHGRARAFVSVNVALRRGEEVLLSRRRGTGWSDGNYGLIAGHVDDGELPEHAAAREVWEEVGIRLHVADLTAYFVDFRTSAAGPYVDVFFRCDRWSGTPRIAEPDKADDLRWVPLTDLPTNVVEYVRVGLQILANGGSPFATLDFEAIDTG